MTSTTRLARPGVTQARLSNNDLLKPNITNIQKKQVTIYNTCVGLCVKRGKLEINNEIFPESKDNLVEELFQNEINPNRKGLNCRSNDQNSSLGTFLKYYDTDKMSLFCILSLRQL